MKCKVCGGTGTSNTCVNGTFKPCTFCDETGEYEAFGADVELDKLYPAKQTNEEWFCSLPTEEKAKWLENKMTWAAQEQGTFTAKGWAKWLKQPHNKGGES